MGAEVVAVSADNRSTMDTIKITLETLYDMLRNEKKKEDLQKLDQAFFFDVVGYLREKQALLEMKKEGENIFASGEKEKLEYELQSIRRILKELYEKREEKIFLEGKINPIKLPKNSSSLHLIQHLRDESHRFAVKYHKTLRDSEMKKSILDEIKGIGEKRKAFILKNVRDLKGITEEDIKKIKGIPKTLIKIILEKIHEHK